MSYHLKTLGLALLVAFAMTATVTSSAQALKVTTGASPAWLTSSLIESSRLTLSGGQSIECSQDSFAATVNNGAETVTVAPVYKFCSAHIGLEVFLATVTMNDCDYLFHGGKEVTSFLFSEGEIDLICPSGKEVEIHVYKKVSETEELCTFKIAGQVNKKANEFINRAGSPNRVSVESRLPVNITRTGSLLCGPASNTATQTGTMEFNAYEDAGGSVSNGTATAFEGSQVSLTISK